MRLVDETRANAIWWEDEGRRIGATLEGVAAAVVTASDPEDAAAVALGIAFVQARRRRAVVADLSGELTAFARLLGEHEGDGIGDTFRYGASLNHIARRVGPGENLYLLPSGAEPVVDEELYSHDRWRRLVAGFREADALLLLVAPAAATALAALTAYTDGAIIAGDNRLPEGIPVIARARAPGSDRRAGERAVASKADIPITDVPRRRSRLPFVAALGALAAAAVAAFALSPQLRGAFSPAPADTVAAAPDATPPRSRVDSAAASVAPVAPSIVNLGDSAAATAWSVELAKFNTPLGALYRVRDELPATTPAATFGVVPIGADATIWYRVIVGASPTRAGADSLIASLARARTIDDPRAALAVHTPLAFVVRLGLSPDSATAEAAELQARGVPAYALRQDNGSTTLYAGAFESPEQAAFFVPTLREAGIEPLLAYRTGRSR